MRKTFYVDITTSAERDVRAIRDLIARDKPRAADKWARTIERKIRSLKSMPQRHEVIPEARELGVEYRHIISGNFFPEVPTLPPLTAHASAEGGGF